MKSDEDQTVEAYWVHIPIPHERLHTSDFGRTLSFDGTLVRIEDRLRPHRLGRSQGADRRHAQNQALTSMINEEFAPLLKGCAHRRPVGKNGTALPGKKSDPGRSGEDNRRFVEAVLWIARTGSPWRDLPAEFGPWNSLFKRFRDWVKGDFFKRLFNAASEEPELPWLRDGPIQQLLYRLAEKRRSSAGPARPL